LDHCAWHATHDKDGALTLIDSLARQKVVILLSNSNTHTMPPSLVRIDANEPLGNILDVIERDGGVIVTDFLSPELLKESMNTSEFGM
jgi:hypothetical protein